MVIAFLAAALLAQEPMAHREGAATTFNFPRASFGCQLATDAGASIPVSAELGGSETANQIGFRGTSGGWPGTLVFDNARPLSSDTAPSAFRIVLRAAQGDSRVEVRMTMGIPAGTGIMLNVSLTHGGTSATGICRPMPRFSDPIIAEPRR